MRGFTLIELLIVVAIIAILAAIAVPNFLEAQTRAKVSRAKADMRSLATAIEAYRVDTNRYPPAFYTILALEDRWRFVTTPVAFITSIPLDPFGDRDVEVSNTAPPFKYQVHDFIVDNPVPTVPKAYVNIDISKRKFWRWWLVTATVTITEGDGPGGPAIMTAIVEGHWSSGAPAIGITGGDGRASFNTWLIGGSGICFTVDSVVKDGQEYDLVGETSDCTSIP